MGLFGGEKYSKEAYNDAVRVANESEDTAEKLKKRQEIYSGEATPQDAYEVYAQFSRERAEQIRQRIEKLKEKGQQEAIDLNNEYKLLLAKAQEAVKTLADFEKEKLGMSGED